MLPLTTVTHATPQKTPLSTPTSTPGKGTDLAYRLLYRGALSLPDSYLQLDGIAFSARLPNQAPQDSPSAKGLMYNPLALALESMRGRQSLRFKGAVALQDVWTDDSGDVYMDIHPFATLTRIYFENMLCLSPLSASQDGPRRTEVGVRVSLGDANGPETTEIVIYGETGTLLHPPLQLASTSVPPPLSMRVARIAPAPRAPRPDDPTPRRPPVRLSGGTTLGDLGANKRILPRSSAGKAKEEEDPVLRRARDVMLHLPRSDVNGRDKNKSGGFKVPELPAKVRRKQGGVADVFGAVELPQPLSATNGKGKGKATVVDGDGDASIANSIEDANKLVLKKMAVRRLSNAGIPRSHAEFKDMFGFVYRGAAFALVKTVHVSTRAAEAVVEAHVKMYVGGSMDASVDVDGAGG